VIVSRRSGPPRKASSTPVSRSTPEAHLLSFSFLPSPQLPPSSPQQPSVIASLPFFSPPPLPARTSLHSVLFHLCQVAQCAVPCPFLADIAFHYLSLCRSLIPLPPPSRFFPCATGNSRSQPEIQEFSLSLSETM